MDLDRLGDVGCVGRLVVLFDIGKVAFGGATGDGDGRAVHVHLRVADAVEPRPGEHVVAGLDAGWNDELVCAGTAAVGIVADIAGCRFGGTATLDGVDDLPFRAGRWRLVACEGDLTRAAAVDGAAGERKCLLGADGHGVTGSFGFVNFRSLLAGEIRAAGFEWTVVEVRLAERCWGLHNHVCVDDGEECEDRKE